MNTDDPEINPPPPLTPQTLEDLRRSIQLALAPPPTIGPGKNILDKLAIVAVLVTDAPTMKALMKATGFRRSLLDLVLDDLVAVGTMTVTAAGVYAVVSPLNPPITESELTTAWRALELTVDCPRCGAPIGQQCISKSDNFTSLHSQRRSAAVSGEVVQTLDEQVAGPSVQRTAA